MPRLSREQPLGTPVGELSFREYRRRYWKDWVLLICTAILGFGLYVAKPASTRVFSIYDNAVSTSSPSAPLTRHLTNVDNSYPIKPEIIPMWLSGFLSFILCFLTFAIAQYWKRSWTDFHTAMMGMFYSMGGSGLFQVFCKWLIGGFRPHFLEVCKPDLSKLAGSGAGEGFGQIYYDRAICTGDPTEINDALQSFPSGHSNAAWAGLLFLFYYLNANLKLYSNRRTPYWKLLVVTLPVLIALLLSLSRLVDYTHHWYDIFVGGIIGCVYATLSWRMQYASIWDWRTNHLPLDNLDEQNISTNMLPLNNPPHLPENSLEQETSDSVIEVNGKVN
ncbi:acid phosphatase/Vanadium-dependent haloperoxidase [Basidiobolus meristosporus CBS 931.73]|uniref:Acid phosphatase/Vanadium-dependent haloperoxidase n=1 Tax=Basidiobolus meristosporus CBS 931.73 TaxID=1314790 RepID=A0A1Y1XZU4_9FUNG|nr:acid phosphatase/Vanadium-dependent haloperoxidase [Basidiobolus meristosporus CBS 931.73]|eukprot:ORX91259.1 acid phosphatase/Vanadium-dependent haloperoxidase [Basidiobolus meristosporus CBS 931.73]